MRGNWLEREGEYLCDDRNDFCLFLGSVYIYVLNSQNSGEEYLRSMYFAYVKYTLNYIHKWYLKNVGLKNQPIRFTYSFSQKLILTLL